MAATGSEVLRRKTGAGRPPPEIVAMSPEKAMRLAFGRAGRDLAGLGLRMTGFAMDRTIVTSLVESVPPRALITTLVRESDGATGTAILEPGFITSVLEAETTGRVTQMPPPDRAATRIDALICSDFLNKALGLFDDVAAGLSLAPAVTGFRMGDVLTSPGTLSLVLDDVPFRTTRLDFEFSGLRQGGIVLAMPFDPPAERAPDPAQGFAPGLQDAVMAAPADVRAVLTRIEVPLESVADWEPGLLLPISRDVLDHVTVEDIDGNTVAHGRLGQMSGNRAVRLRLNGDN